MNVQVKSSNGITLVPLETRLLANRRVFIKGEINAESACLFSQEVMLLNQEDPSARIEVLINSPGGEINSGMLMYDIIQSSPAPIRLICLGRAYSMGAILFASGSHGRYMMPHGELMIHEPLLGNLVGGNSSSMKSISDSLLATRRKLNQILARHTKHTEQEIEEATSYDHYFNPEESIEFGLCDGMIGFDEVMAMP